MKIFITGATGFIGTNLIDKLLLEGHEVVCYVRDIEKARQKIKGKVEFLGTSAFPGHVIKILERCDAVVNLAGEPIAQRWSKKVKKKIYNSRIDITKNLSTWISACRTPPKVFISSSAVGFYGNRGDQRLTESSDKSSGWLSHLCNQWEKESYPSNPENIIPTRVVNLRTGIVLGDGGALKKMLLPFKMGIGGVLGSGNQWMPWIHIEDMVNIIIRSINDENIYGPINCVAPAAVTNRHFTKILGKTLKRPTIFPVPSFILKIIFGEGACILLDSQKVRPIKLIRRGFSWKFGSLYTALEDLLRK